MYSIILYYYYTNFILILYYIILNFILFDGRRRDRKLPEISERVWKHSAAKVPISNEFDEPFIGFGWDRVQLCSAILESDSELL